MLETVIYILQIQISILELKNVVSAGEESEGTLELSNLVADFRPGIRNVDSLRVGLELFQGFSGGGSKLDFWLHGFRLVHVCGVAGDCATPGAISRCYVLG